MAEFRVVIPEEHIIIVKFIQEDSFGVAALNSALKKFEPKEVFAWHLSIMIELEDLIDDRMPSKEERLVVDEFGDLLDENIKGFDKQKPNALFLGRITWNGTRELLWRVYEPESANNYLQQIISNGSCPRAFDYRIDRDAEWKLAEWHLSH